MKESKSHVVVGEKADMRYHRAVARRLT